MFKMWGMILSGLFLIVESIEDIKEKSLSPKILSVFGFMAFIYYLSGQEGIKPFILNTLTGLGVLAFGFATGWKLGMGDGLVILILGLYLGKTRVLRVFLTALFLSAAAGIILLILKKAKRKTRIPFVPFILVAFLTDIYMMRAGWV